MLALWLLRSRADHKKLWSTLRKPDRRLAMIGSWDKREWWLEAMGSLVVNTFFEVRLEQLIRLAESVEEIFSAAELEYRLVGGVATYFYVEEASPDAGRLTKDVDVVVRREDLEKIPKQPNRSDLDIGRWRESTCWSGCPSQVCEELSI